jgi:hypothetical protein
MLQHAAVKRHAERTELQMRKMTSSGMPATGLPASV